MIQRAERSIKLIEAQTPDVYAGPRPAASRVNNASTRLYYLPTALITYMWSHVKTLSTEQSIY